MNSLFYVFILIFPVLATETLHSRNRRQYPVHRWPPSNAVRTRSLSGTYANDGNNTKNEEIYNLLTRTITQGFAVWKIKAFNDRIFLDRYRRSYWFGDRYYKLDNRYFLETRDTCSFALDDKEKQELQYEEGDRRYGNTQIYDIYYQCQRYVEFCCGLQCCRNEEMFTKAPTTRRYPRNPWSMGAEVFCFSTIFMNLLIVFA